MDTPRRRLMSANVTLFNAPIIVFSMLVTITCHCAWQNYRLYQQ